MFLQNNLDMLKRKIKQNLKKLPKGLAENAFLVSLILFFLALILGGLELYQCISLIEKKEQKINTTGKILLFNEKSFQEILNIWQERQKRFEEIKPEEFLHLFRFD